MVVIVTVIVVLVRVVGVMTLVFKNVKTNGPPYFV